MRDGGERGNQKAQPQVEVIYKHCPTCGLTKVASEFNRSKRSKDGLYWECRSCQRQRNKRDYAAHKEKRLEKAKAWKAENLDKVKRTREQYKPRRREVEREKREQERQRRIEALGLRPWSVFKPEDDNDIKSAIKDLE